MTTPPRHCTERRSLFRLLPPAALVLLLVAPSFVRAGEPVATSKDRVRATTLVREGARLLESNQHAAAVERFEQAFRLYASPKIHFNIGLAEEGRGQTAAAYRAFRRYLHEATTDAPARRREATAHLEALAPRVGLLVIDTDPALTGAAVLVDEAAMGVAPLVAPVPVDPGSHAVIVRPATGTPWVDTVKIAGGETVRLAARPAPSATVPPAPAAVALTPPSPDPALAANRAAPVRAPEAAIAVPIDQAPAPSTSLFSRGWFWGAAGAVVVAGAVTALVLGRGGAGGPACPPAECQGPIIVIPGGGR